MADSGKIILASASPRRAKILADLGIAFDIVKTDAKEVSYPGDPERTVRENALAKGAAAGGGRVLSADTVVWLDGRIYGKPSCADEAKEFLRSLSGKTHSVFTAVAYCGETAVVRSRVTFRELSEADIDGYVAKVNPLDRAGAYDIDESGEMLIKSWTGSYENIMGLPTGPLVDWGLAPAPPSALKSRILRVASHLVAMLEANSLSCATAESCTGGGVGAAITSIPGSSAVFKGGVTSYANEVKRDVLGVSQETLDTVGAVSPETASQMAEGARKLMKADMAVSLTGVAGPGGGSAEKPVGLVWFGLADAKGVRTEKAIFPGDREAVRLQAVLHALGMLTIAAS
ncbi:MAG: nicotinamide-nucleotide amidohydrolase family protein [Kiritimatiellae bacterium]|nr:nicotinamide-nucleotide amidohydrolase family protein [Kiritimatiellia bacterium]